MSSFTVAGMSGMSSSTSSHAHNLNSWGVAGSSSQLGSSLSDSLSQPPRSQYQSGYLLSTSRDNNAPQSSQRVDELPLIQTKAKLNSVFARGSSSEFGMNSMFHSTHQHQALADEDAPPRKSVYDIPYEVCGSALPRTSPRKKLSLETSRFGRRPPRAPATQLSQPLYVVVFGYPPERYSFMVEYFKSLGNATEPERNTEVVNSFKIGYHDTADVIRAIGKNGDVISGSFMIGTKWADSTHAEAVFGSSFRTIFWGVAAEVHSSGNAADTNETTQPPFASNVPSIGTPIKVMPAEAAYRKPGALSKPRTPFPTKSTNSSMSNTATSDQGMLRQLISFIWSW
ncbi:hypothetical protein Ac2012v2_002953 [Leucoagaricus gongylophorus]